MVGGSERTLYTWLLDQFSWRLFGTLIRFGLVGLACGTWYAAIAWGLIELAEFEPPSASLLAYVSAIPLSFLGHREFTFGSRGPRLSESFKFVVVQGANMWASYQLMETATDTLSFSYWVGIGACILIVPFITFVLLNAFVFVARERHH